MTAVVQSGSTEFYRKAVSIGTGPAVTVEMELDGEFRALTHVFLAVVPLQAGVPAVDSTGTFTVTVQTLNQKLYEAPVGSVIDATAPTTISWAGNTLKIKVVPAALTDTDTYEVIVTGNRN